jgi:hypothetical protein
MPYPPASHLDPAALGAAVELARALRRAAASLDELTSGAEGRNNDATMVIYQWLGPSRQVFDRLIENERHSATAARERLLAEADSWDRFCADATNARNERLLDEARAQHRANLARDGQDVTS